MKQPNLVAALGGALAGGLTAALVAWPIASAPPAGEPAAVTPPRTDPGLAADLAALRAEQERLARRVQELEMRPLVQTTREPALATETEIDAELKAWMDSLRDPSGSLPDRFVANVDSALRSIREAEERERQDRRRETVDQEVEDRVGELALELGLTPYQQGEMRTVLINAIDLRDEAKRGARASGDFASVRESMRDIRAKSHEALALVLTPDQMKQYEDMQADDRGGRGGGFGRPRPADSGAGGGDN